MGFGGVGSGLDGRDGAKGRGVVWRFFKGDW